MGDKRFSPLYPWPDAFRTGADACGLTPTDRVLAAVSGGADSTALAVLLSEWLRSPRLQLVLAHVHHGVRGRDADEDEAFVVALARALDAGVVTRRVEWQAGSPPGEADEAVLREHRYRLLKEMAAAAGIGTIALAHQRDDAAETLLLMALRGSGPTGLALRRTVDLRPRGGPVLVRPLLDCRRAELEDFLRGRGQEWREDQTNASMRPLRNRLRHEVLPVLEQASPGSVDGLASTVGLCAEAARALESAGSELLRHALVARCETAVVLDSALLRIVPRAVGAEAVKSLWRGEPFGLIGRQDAAADSSPLLPSRGLLEGILNRVASPPDDDSAFPPHEGIRVIVTNSHLIAHSAPLAAGEALDGLAARWEPPLAPRDWQRILLVDEARGVREVALPCGIEWGVCGAQDYLPRAARLSSQEARRRGAAFDMARISLPLSARLISPGDRMALAPDSTTDAAEVLRAARIPRPLRDRALGIFDAEGLLIIPGLRRSRRAPLAPATSLVLWVEWPEPR